MTMDRLFIGLALVLASAACAAPPAQQQVAEKDAAPRDGALVRIASPWSPTDLDVHGRSNNGNFRRFVWESLLDHDRPEPLKDFRIDYDLVPSLAESWEQPAPNV